MTVAAQASLEPARPPGRLLACVTGVISASFGLAAAELVAGSSSDFASPIVAVGDRVVDLVPSAVKDLAITLFGTNDKVALLVGMGLTIMIFAGAVGYVAFYRSLMKALASLAAFAIIGSAAALFTRTGVDWFGPTPTVIGSFLTAVTLRAAVGRFGPDRGDTADPMASRPNDRRRLLATLGAVSAAGLTMAYTGRRLDGNRSNVAEVNRQSFALPDPAAPLPSAPTAIQAPNAAPFFTPTDDFYRIDTALVVPRVPIDTWELSVNGLVENPVRYSFDKLISEFDVVEADITLTCVSNTVGGNLVGTARWLGVRLDEIVQRSGIQASADQIVGRSVDGYTCGFPVSALDGRDALVAFAMNGEPLPAEHGYPARLIVPGLYGYVSATKWLTEIELTTFDAFDHYWVPRGYSAEAPIKQQSRIDSPRGLDRIPAGATVIGGVAWAQTIGIEAVELSIDDGPWVEAVLADELSDTTWRQWSLPWEASPGRHTITVRSRNRNGAIQAEARSEPLPDGASGHHTIVVLVDA